MSLFHHDEREAPAHDAPDFEVVDDDGTTVHYARSEFDEIFETTDPAEVQQQVERGWLILAERQVEHGGRGPSGEDLIPGIGSLRAGGMLGYEPGESQTVYTLGFLAEDAR
jgi:hypothetical protein